MSKIDIEAGVKKVRENLISHGFRPRDADGSDFQYGDDPSLRFKVNCVYGEVTVSVWKHARQVKQPFRATSDAQIVEVNHSVDALVNEFFMKRQTPDKGSNIMDEPPVVERFFCTCGHPGAGCYCR